MEDWEWNRWAEENEIEDLTVCAICKDVLDDDYGHFVCEDCDSLWSKQW